ncbi:MAG TPA: hypothetical protein PKN75_05825 [Bacteroidia bacterium]|nr:hypothetical protein [Bacteroidia bacterium]HNU33093.1 hypothetical protein [Bacteroidia bacterium]
MELVLCIIYALALAFVFYKWRYEQAKGVPQYFFPLLFIVKCIAGIAYSYYLLTENKGGDMFWYMQETNYLFDSCRQQPILFFKYVLGIEDLSTTQITGAGATPTWNKPDFFINDARTLIRVNLLIRLVSLGAWQVHTVVFCFISTLGFVYLSRFFSRIFNSNKTFTTLAISLFPSVFLWTSLILKESLLVCFLGVFLFSLHKVVSRKAKTRTYFLTFIFFMLLLTVKPFVILLLIPFLVAYYVCTEMQSARWILMRWGVVVFFFWMLAVVVGNVSKDYSIPYRLYTQQQSSLKFAVFRGDKSYHKPPIIAPCWTSIIKRSPEAVYNALILPLFNITDSYEKKAAALENILLTAALIISVYFWWRLKIKNLNSVILCLLFAFVLLAVTGLTTAVIGALIRYKIIGILFISAFISYCFSAFLFNNKRKRIS